MLPLPDNLNFAKSSLKLSFKPLYSDHAADKLPSVF